MLSHNHPNQSSNASTGGCIIMQACLSKELCFEDQTAGVFMKTLFNTIKELGYGVTFENLVPAVYAKVRDVVRRGAGATQSPGIHYVGSARATDKVSERFVQLRRIVVIVPTYTGTEALRGARECVQSLLARALWYYTNPACEFVFVIDGELRFPKVPYRPTKDRFTFVPATQLNAWNAIEEAVTSGQDYLIITMGHGKVVDKDEQLYFANEPDQLHRINGKYLGGLPARSAANFSMQITEFCYAGGAPDPQEIVPYTVTLTSRAIPPGYNSDDECGTLQTMVVRMTDRLSRLVSVDKDIDFKADLTVTNKHTRMITQADISQTDGCATLTMKTNPVQEAPVGPSAPESLPPSTPTMPASAQPPQLQPRNIQAAARLTASLLGGAAVRTLAATWSAVSAFLLAAENYTGVGRETLMALPFYFVLVAMVFSFVAAMGFYLHVAAAEPGATLSPVIMTVLTGWLLQYLLGQEAVRAWVPQDASVGILVAVSVVSLVTMLYSTAATWRRDRGCKAVVSTLMGATEFSSELAKLSLLLMQMHLFGGGEGHVQAMVIRAAGVERYVVYSPLTVVNSTTREIGCRLLTAEQKYLRIHWAINYSMMNDTYGVTCRFDVFKLMVHKFSGGDPAALYKWKIGNETYNLRVIGQYRDAALKYTGLTGPGPFTGTPDSDRVNLESLASPLHSYIMRNCPHYKACFHAPVPPTAVEASRFLAFLEAAMGPFQSCVDGLVRAVDLAARAVASHL